jgi:acyl-CoA synthetase (AMP-forming)/AMP-acid ligase II
LKAISAHLGRWQLLRGGPRRLRLGGVLEAAARLHGSTELFRAVGPTPPGARSHLTGEEAADYVAALAGGIAEASRPGGRVALVLPNSYEMVLAIEAVARVGRVAVPVNDSMTEAEVAHVLNDCEPDLTVRGLGELGGLLASGPAPAVESRSGDLACLLYTSGTTGRPKGACLSHQALMANLFWAPGLPSALTSSGAFMCLPLSHVMGLFTALHLGLAGVTVHFMGHFQADNAVEALAQRRPDLVVGVPSMYRLLLAHGAFADGRAGPLKSVRLFVSGADAMAPELVRALTHRGRLVGWRNLSVPALLVEGYGTVETGGPVLGRLHWLARSSQPPRALAFPLAGSHLRVVDGNGQVVAPGQLGSLEVRLDGSFLGYFRDPEATARPWFATGDLAVRSRLGLVAWRGRDRDLIKRGGYAVYPAEVEAVLAAHPAVRDAGVVGRPDSVMGEVPVAFVVLDEASAHPAMEMAILQYCRERLAAYKRPAEIVAVDSLPHTGTGKLKRSELAQWVQSSSRGAGAVDA